MSDHKFKRGDIVRVLGQKIAMTVLSFHTSKIGEDCCQTGWFDNNGHWLNANWYSSILEIIPYPDQPYRDV